MKRWNLECPETDVLPGLSSTEASLVPQPEPHQSHDTFVREVNADYKKWAEQILQRRRSKAAAKLITSTPSGINEPAEDSMPKPEVNLNAIETEGHMPHLNDGFDNGMGSFNDDSHDYPEAA